MSSEVKVTKSKNLFYRLVIRRRLRRSPPDSPPEKRTLSVCQSDGQSDCLSRSGPRSYWSIESAMLPLCSISTGPSLRGSLRGRSPLIA